MKKKTKEPVLTHAPRVVLKKLTCAQLADWIEAGPQGEECETNEALRGRYAHAVNLHKLRLCGNLCASHHAAHVRTAARLLRVPTIEMRVAGGKPDSKKMPRYDAALKAMGAQHGLVIHRWEKGAFILHHPKKEPVNLELPLET